MEHVKIYEWNKKNRTMLRFIKSGDIFCFKVKSGGFRFGRIVAKLSVGHAAEIFSKISATPEITEEDVRNREMAIPLVAIDSYSLFDKKISGDWRIIGRQDGYVPDEHRNTFFSYGVGDSCKRIGIDGRAENIISSEKKKYLPYVTRHDESIQAMLSALE